ncbi:GNAT family N-acetyltransferase [Nonomuraea sp. NPDC050786]|uniref:GNAT family N-acetyltransferase n=1 Tax=Nonomuraea sp. NPDC050786 TaxID=3154840 RepID=UPI0033C3510F
MGYYIAFEGVDGAGKSTGIRAALAAFRERGVQVFGVGQHSWLDIESTRVIIDAREQRRTPDVADIADAYIRDRALQNGELLTPLLEEAHVVGDRSIYSDAVYQEAIYGIPAEQILKAYHDLGGRCPDLVVFFSIDPGEAAVRIEQRGGLARHYETKYTLDQITTVYERVLFDEQAARQPVYRYTSRYANDPTRLSAELMELLDPYLSMPPHEAAPDGLDRSLRTDRLVLRPFQPCDLACVARLRADVSVVRYMGTSVPYQESLARLRADMARYRAAWETDGFELWAVVLPETGCAIGYCGLRRFDRLPGEVELVCALEPDYWGRGFGPEACSGALAHAFENLGLARVVATSHPENVRSHGLIAKINLCDSGQIAATGGVTKNYYTIEASDWAAEPSGSDAAR